MSLDLSSYADLMRALAPESLLTGLAMVVLLLVAWRHRTAADTRLAGVATLVALAATAVVVWWLWWNRATVDGIAQMIAVDDFRFVVDWIFLGAAALTVLFSFQYLEREGLLAPEYYPLLLFAVLGMMLMAGGEDLMVIFLGLELMSISVYVLAGFNRRSPRSAEAALKYFLLGAFASAFLLYGIALIYGATGSTGLDRIAASPAAKNGDPLVMAGLGLMLVGFGFKISSVPFHMWAPDVYQGAPTTVTSFIATGSKAAAFAALIRVLVVSLRGAQSDWAALLWGIAVVTMTVGNVVALAQSNLKRMLAYSSIAHVGYMLMGLVAGGAPGAGAILFYLLAYTFTIVGAFGVIGLCARAGEEAVEVGDYSGMARRHPVLAATLTLFMLSLVGIPPLAGFVAKFYLFGSAVRAGYLWLTVVAVLNSAIAAYYYLRVIVYMYMREPEGEGLSVTPSLAGGLALTIALVGLVLLGLMPAPFADLAQAAVTPLLR